MYIYIMRVIVCIGWGWRVTHNLLAMAVGVRLREVVHEQRHADRHGHKSHVLPLVHLEGTNIELRTDEQSARFDNYCLEHFIKYSRVRLYS